MRLYFPRCPGISTFIIGKAKEIANKPLVAIKTRPLPAIGLPQYLASVQNEKQTARAKQERKQTLIDVY